MQKVVTRIRLKNLQFNSNVSNKTKWGKVSLSATFSQQSSNKFWNLIKLLLKAFQIRTLSEIYRFRWICWHGAISGSGNFIRENWWICDSVDDDKDESKETEESVEEELSVNWDTGDSVDVTNVESVAMGTLWALWKTLLNLLLIQSIFSNR